MTLSWVTIIWSAAASACLTLALVHLVIWLKQPRQYAHLVFSALAVSVAAIAACELLLMRAQTPVLFGEILRWRHIPVSILIILVVLYVRLYFRAGSLWLAGGACVLRLLALAINFHVEPNLNYGQITGLRQVEMPGGEMVSVAVGTLGPWVWIGQLSNLLLLLFVAHASVALWRRGGRIERQRAAFVGGSYVLFIAVAAGSAALLNAGVIQIPYILSMYFLAIVAATGYELSSDVVRAAQLAEQLQQSEAEFRQSKRRMEQASEAAGIGAWEWDIVRDTTWMTDQGRALLGLPPEERIDLHRFLNALNSEDREAVREAVERSREQGGDFQREYRVELPGGAVRWIHSRGRVELGGGGRAVLMHGISVDITKRKQADLALRESEERFRIMADTAPVMIWMAGTDRLCTFFNKGWLDFTGRTPEQESGNGWAEGVHREDLEHCLDVYASAFDARQEFAMEYRLRRCDGEYRWVLDHGVPRFASDGAFLGYIGTCIDISERKERDNLLKRERAFLLQIIEINPNLIFAKDRQGQFTLANKAVADIYGTTVAGLIGKTDADFAPNAEEVEAFRRGDLQVMDTLQELFIPDDYITDASGNMHWLQTVKRPILGEDGTANQVLGSATDITRRKQMELALQESEDRYRQVVENAGVFVWEVNAQGLYTYAGPRVEQILGYTPEQLVGKKHFYDLFVPTEREELKAAVFQVIADRKAFRDFANSHVSKGGNIVHLETSGTPMLDLAGNFVGYRGADVDVTARKYAELELDRRRNELAHLSRVTMLSELSGSLAHELNQPLTAILSNAQAALRFLAGDKPNLGELREILRDIVNDDKRAGEVIKGLRAMLKKGQMRHEPVDLNEVVLSVLKLLRSDIVNAGVKLITKLAPAAPNVHGDRVQLQQVLLNLVVNGCDAMAGNATTERQLVVSTDLADDECILISVADQGPGVAPEDLERVFEPFFTTKGHGLGLGLSVCRQIVSAHGGRLWAANAAARGAIFCFTVPAGSGSTA